MKKVLKELEETLKRTIMHKKIKRNVSYEHLIKLELYKLIKHLMEEQEYQGFKIWWQNVYNINVRYQTNR